MEYGTLHNHLKIPLVGFGVYRLESQEEMTTAISHALKNGYTLFDTAQMYKNEAELGNALKAANAKREELFLVSKVDNGNQWYDSTKKSFMESLEKLQTDYLDLLLIHWPGKNKERTLSTWKAMEELYEAGKIKSIGVSNFEIHHLEHLIANSKIKPMVNQIEHTPYTHDEDLLAYCKEEQIQIMAWAPLLRGNMGNPIFLELAEKYQCTTAQLILRWNIQQGITVIPKSKNPSRIAENIDIFKFEILEEDMKTLSSLNRNHRTSHDPNVFDF
uniref:aldo/keto reductase n=1 Tax=Agathobacter sp. TaxID=2021311 RepID=UPI004055EDF0